MKKFLAIFLVLTLCFSLFAACGKGGDKTESPDSQPDVPKGTQYDTGTFQVFIPDGWKEFAVYDVFAEQPETVDPDALQIIKGGKNSMDVFSKPYIDIRYYGPDTLGYAPYKDLYDEVEDISPLELDNFTFTGFTCISYDVPITILWTDDGVNQIQVAVYTDQEDGDITLEDEDVMMILESILPAAGIPEKPADTPDTPTVEADYMLWSGYWYGWWCITNATGKFAEVNDFAWDTVAYTSVWGNSGEMTIWDSATSWSNPLMEVDVTFEEGSTSMGVLHVSDGDMFPYRHWLNVYNEVTPMVLETDVWVVDPGNSTVSQFENMIEITGRYEDSEDASNSFDYCIYLRPWGTLWDDVKNGNTDGCIYSDMMPVLYDTWYLPILDLGYITAPDDFEIGFDRIENQIPY